MNKQTKKTTTKTPIEQKNNWDKLIIDDDEEELVIPKFIKEEVKTTPNKPKENDEILIIPKFVKVDDEESDTVIQLVMPRFAK